MKVVVQHFAVLRERRGCQSESVEVAPGTTVGGLYALLFPPGAEGVLPVGYARNQSWVGADEPVAEGDEIAFLPPLGGG